MSGGLTTGSQYNSHLHEFLKNGSSIDANVNGSVTPVEFSFTATSWTWDTTMHVTVQDNGSFSAANYGGVSTLANGIECELVLDGVTHDILGGAPVKSLADWSTHAFDLTLYTFGAGDNYAAIRWDFEEVNGLRLAPGDQFIVRINDNLTGLTGHKFHLHGRL